MIKSFMWFTLIILKTQMFKNNHLAVSKCHVKFSLHKEFVALSSPICLWRCVKA